MATVLENVETEAYNTNSEVTGLVCAAQDGDRCAGDAVPVAEGRLASRIEEDEPGGVDWPRRRGVQLAEQRAAELVGRQDVDAVVAREHGAPVTLTPARTATSSRRSPGTRRLP